MVATVNGKPYAIPIEWPPIDEAMQIVERDLHHPDGTIKLTIREVLGGIYYGRMWQEVPEGIEGDCWKTGDVDGEITAHALTQEDVVRELAAIIKATRIGGAAS